MSATWESEDLDELLASAMHEIRELRRQNEILGVQVRMIDLFAVVLNTEPRYPSQGMAQDIAWQIERALEKRKEAAAARPTPPDDPLGR